MQKNTHEQPKKNTQTNAPNPFLVILANSIGYNGFAFANVLRLPYFSIKMSIPVQFEPAVQSLRATIPEAQSHRYCHQKHYSTVLLTRASTAYVFMAKQQSCPGGHVCLGIEAYHMPTHVKSLSRHNISDGSL